MFTIEELAKMTWVCTVLFFNYSTSSVFKINSRVGYEGGGAQHGRICTFSLQIQVKQKSIHISLDLSTHALRT